MSVISSQYHQDRAALIEQFNLMSLEQMNISIAAYVGILSQMLNIYYTKKNTNETKPSQFDQIDETGDESI